MKQYCLQLVIYIFIEKEIHAVCRFPIIGTIPFFYFDSSYCTFLLKIFPMINSVNTFVTEKENLSIFYISSRNATFFKTAVYINRDNRFNLIPLAEKPVVDISSSPESNIFPIGASINLTCKAEPRAEDVSHLDRWVNYIQWYDPQGNEVGEKCQQPDRKNRVKEKSCPLVLKNLTVDKFGNYTCQSGNDYPNHCTRKSFNIGIQGKQIKNKLTLCDKKKNKLMVRN